MGKPLRTFGWLILFSGLDTADSDTGWTLEKSTVNATSLGETSMGETSPVAVVTCAMVPTGVDLGIEWTVESCTTRRWDGWGCNLWVVWGKGK